MDAYLGNAQRPTTAASQGLWVALFASLLLHIGLGAWTDFDFLLSTEPPRTHLTTPSLDVILDNHPILTDLEIDESPVVPPSLPKLSKSPQPPTPSISVVEPNERPSERPATATLDLRSPSAFRDLVDPGLPQTEVLESFNAEQARGLAKRQLRQQQRANSAAARRLREGLEAEHYAHVDALGEKIKTAKGCFTKVQESGLNGMQTRWYRSACRDGARGGMSFPNMSYSDVAD